MNVLTRLRTYFRPTRKNGPNKPGRLNRYRPTVENLEERLVPAGVSLGSAANYAVLGLVQTQINNSNVTITGNEGVSQGGTLTNMAPSTITGNAYEYASGQYSGPGKLGGSVVVNPALLAQADSDALNAAATAAALTPTQTFGSISSPTTVYGNGGVNVIQINGNITSSLILSGSSTDTFIVNVTGSVNLSGSTTLGLAGGLQASQVLYNFTGSSGSVDTKVGNVLNGTLLAPTYSFSLDGVFNGEIIGGGSSITLLSQAHVNEVSFSPPLSPASISGYVDTTSGAPLANVTITLTGTDADGNAVDVTATTNASGFYQFTNVTPGMNYTLTVGSVSGYTASSATAGTVNGATDGSNGTSQITSVTLNSGDAGVNYDFVEAKSGGGFAA